MQCRFYKNLIIFFSCRYLSRILHQKAGKYRRDTSPEPRVRNAVASLETAFPLCKAVETEIK